MEVSGFKPGVVDGFERGFNCGEIRILTVCMQCEKYVSRIGSICADSQRKITSGLQRGFEVV